MVPGSSLVSRGSLMVPGPRTRAVVPKFPDARNDAAAPVPGRVLASRHRQTMTIERAITRARDERRRAGERGRRLVFSLVGLLAALCLLGWAPMIRMPG